MMNKERLNTQLKAIDRYITLLNKVMEENKPLTEAYKTIVNELRAENGLKPLDYEAAKDFKERVLKNIKEEI